MILLFYCILLSVILLYAIVLGTYNLKIDLWALSAIPGFEKIYHNQMLNFIR